MTSAESAGAEALSALMEELRERPTGPEARRRSHAFTKAANLAGCDPIQFFWWQIENGRLKLEDLAPRPGAVLPSFNLDALRVLVYTFAYRMDHYIEGKLFVSKKTVQNYRSIGNLAVMPEVSPGSHRTPVVVLLSAAFLGVLRFDLLADIYVEDEGITDDGPSFSEEDGFLNLVMRILAPGYKRTEDAQPED